MNVGVVRWRTRSAATAPGSSRLVPHDSVPVLGPRPASEAIRPVRKGGSERLQRWADQSTGWAALRTPPRSRGAGPAVIVLHGWLAIGLQQFALRRLMAGVHRAGFDVWYPWLPLHGPRAPAGEWSGAGALTADMARTSATVAQGVAETCELAAWLREGGQPVSVLGFSLGGWTAALTCTVDAGLERAVLYAPVVDHARAFVDSPLVSHIREGLEESGADADAASRLLEKMTVANHAPATPGDRILIVGGRDDNVASRESLETLAQRWGASLRMTEAGHVSSQWSLTGRRAARDWLLS